MTSSTAFIYFTATASLGFLIGLAILSLFVPRRARNRRRY